jgi:hypothetical protein
MVPLGLHLAQDILEVAALAVILLWRQHMTCAAGMEVVAQAVLIMLHLAERTQLVGILGGVTEGDMQMAIPAVAVVEMVVEANLPAPAKVVPVVRVL